MKIIFLPFSQKVDAGVWKCPEVFNGETLPDLVKIEHRSFKFLYPFLIGFYENEDFDSYIQKWEHETETVYESLMALLRNLCLDSWPFSLHKIVSFNLQFIWSHFLLPVAIAYSPSPSFCICDWKGKYRISFL